MNITEFETGSLNEEFKELAEWIFGDHYQEFTITVYTDDEEAVDIKIGASGIILDQSQIDNLEIDILDIDGIKEISTDVRTYLEHKLIELFEL